MNIIIVGGGKVGTEIISALCPEGHNIALVDKNQHVIDEVSENYDILGVCGSGVITSTLEQAGIFECDLLIATTNMDEVNALACVIARKMGARGTIARIRDPELNSQVLFMREKLGVSMMVNPEYSTAREISRILRIPSATHVESFAKGRIDMVEFTVPQNGILDGIALKDMPSKLDGRVIVCAVQRNGTDDAVIPDGNFILHAGERVHICARHAEISSFFRQIGLIKNKIKRVMLIGGGKIAYYLSRMLVDAGMNVKIIEQSHERCLELARMLPKVRIINGNGAMQDLLLDEGIGDMDACVTLTNMDEDNIITSMFARMQNSPKVITKVNSSDLRRMAFSVGLESCVSPKELTADMILSYVRAIKQTAGGVMKSMYKLVDGKVEAMEFLATDDGHVTGVPLAKLRFKSNLLIAGIFRDGKIIFPNGNDVIIPGDVVIVVTLNRFLTSLDQILA